MSDTSNDEAIYKDGGVPADADLNPEGSDVAASLPGGSRLDEGEDDGLSADDVKPSGGVLP